MPDIHPTAIVADTVTIGEGTTVLPYTIIEGNTVIGRNCTIGPHAAIGGPPQHRNSPIDDGWVVIGDDCVLREQTTVNRATKPGRDNATAVGDRCYLMTSVHLGHDTKLGADITLANQVMIAGHAAIGDGTFFGGGTGIHQYSRVGRLCMIHGNEGLSLDVPPFALVQHTCVRGPNVIGLRRNGFSSETRQAIARAYQTLRRVPVMSKALAQLECVDVPEVREIVEFYRASKRGVTTARRKRV
ncbi:MAG: acyl-[acyl-carrier-protein]--UDP-N-acetylglucosamine O-acyltransferase [Planctomycetota bacterium]